jgi:hypothetical protein
MDKKKRGGGGGSVFIQFSKLQVFRRWINTEMFFVSRRSGIELGITNVPIIQISCPLSTYAVHGKSCKSSPSDHESTALTKGLASHVSSKCSTMSQGFATGIFGPIGSFRPEIAPLESLRDHVIWISQ